jgi:hypothetical protein
MSSEELSNSHDVEPKPELKHLQGEIAPDVAHIASLLGPEYFEPPVAPSPRSSGIREDVKMLASELFEVAKAKPVRPSLKVRVVRTERV